MRGAHVAAVAAAALLFASYASAQGLGDVAAREKEKRTEEKTEGKKPSKVYTQADLGASVAPWLEGCWGFPSIFVGRPMLLSARIPRPKPRKGKAVA